MTVSREIILNRITNKTRALSRMMSLEFGGSTVNWLKCIQQTNLYANLLDTETHMWSEGDMYLRDCLVDELKERKALHE